jgi:asparagine synthase (glutamine-hydrolysing)
MCGIFGLLSQNEDSFNLQNLNNPNHRGPDNTNINNSINNIYFQFHRLCINDLSDCGNQPFENDKYIWMCNGEIYNYKQLKYKYNITCKSNSDCEVIGYLIDILGIQSISRILDGVFSISILDKTDNTLYLIRDPIGVRPLYYYNDENILAFASEGKTLDSIVEHKGNITQFPQSSYMIYNYNSNTYKITKYFNFDNININNNIKFNDLHSDINNMLVDSVKKRLISDRPIGCLLSGGLDSSLIASILSKLLKDSGKKLKTFSVGFKDSEDLKYAKKVAKYLKTDHYELVLDYDEAIGRIPELIKHIETYDVTTVRASIGMYLLSEYISKNHPEKVIFSGEGADELFGGYLYFHLSPSHKHFEQETVKLMKELHYFDVLRSDRCTSAFGLELRVPFLDKEFVKYVLSIPGIYRQYNYLEKYILRMSFKDNYLPTEILMRKKEAFSDGVGGMKKPFYKHIQESILQKNIYNISNEDQVEKQYYKDIYYNHYSYQSIPYYWMPKWVNNIHNPSARLLLN